MGKKIKSEVPEDFLKTASIFMDKGLKKLRISTKEVTFLCPHCNKVIKIKI
jgi:hypothetical protein